MMPLSFALAARCDAILRLDGVSSGADAEVERVRANGGIVYRRVEEIPDALTRPAHQTADCSPPYYAHPRC